MKITSIGIENKIINPRFGKYGTQFYKNMPTNSLPLRFSEYPNNTRSFALTIEDKDMIPEIGFSWIHWIAANITKNALLENESQSTQDFIQGANSWSSTLLGAKTLTRIESSQYGGCSPSNTDHTYDITVYALDMILELHQGFYMNELLKAMKGHIIDSEVLHAVYIVH